MSLQIAALAAFAACALAVHAPQRYSKSANLLSRARTSDTAASVSTNETHFDTYGSAASRPPSCMRNTGVSCLTTGCDASHGEATCKFGQCVCTSGCSSAKGECLHEANVLILSGLRLRNAQWPTYYMVASTMDSQVHVTTSSTDALARFNLYKLPGQGDHPQDFLLVPQASPAHSISVVHDYSCAGDIMEVADSKQKQNANLSSPGCEHTWKARANPMVPSFSSNPSVQDVGVRLWRAPISDKEHAGAITIRGTGSHVNKFMFVHDGSWGVSIRQDDPGPGGYWIPDPPLPFTLPMYDGPPCQHRCNDQSGARSLLASSFLLLLIIQCLY